MTRSPPRSREDGSQISPVVSRVPILFLLVNVPALLLVGWLGISLASHLWVEHPVGLPPLELPLIPTVGMLAGLVGGFIGNLLLYHRIGGVTSRLAGTLRERADQEAQLRAILKTAADGILTVDEGKHLLSLNDAACRMFDYERGELLGRPYDVLLSRGVSLDSVGTREQHVLGLGASLEGKRKDGSRFPISLAVSKVRLAGRAIFALIVHDLTTLKQAQRDAEAASRAKSEFLANVSHELRTPLNGILGMAQVLGSGTLLPDQMRQLATLTRSAESLVALLEQVLDYARLETGELRLSPGVFSLRALLREVAGEWKSSARAKGLRLREEVPPELPDSFLGDAARLRQVLGHLVSNAVKFTPAGTIIVRARREGALYFEVEDTGIGIPADKLQSIFTAFEQADGSSTRQHGGVGLGLSLASRLVRLMGGEVEVESVPGRGSVFRVRVPAMSTDDSFHEVSLPRAPLLLVSADEGERQELERLLRGWGWEVVGVADGRGALAELMRRTVQGSPFGRVVWQDDAGRPESGELLRQLSDSPARCPVVLLRDGATPAEAERPAGVGAVLPRTPSPRELHEVLSRCDAAGPSLAAS
jgi:PAS domain S-box-containing protein